MQDLETLRNGGYRAQNLQRLKLSCPLTEFPPEILDLAASLEQLDLSGTGLSSLPDDIRLLRKLKVAFFSDCNFNVFPKQLGACPSLEMVAFRGNRMAEIPENAFPTNLRWLILTNNHIETLPQSIGQCPRLQKCMLAGNRLRSIPDTMAACKKLGLLRLSANCLATLPSWLFEMPELSFLSVAGNPCCPPDGESDLPTTPDAGRKLRDVRWLDLQIQGLLGQGASGDIYRGQWTRADSAFDEVAVKLFKGDVTSDGTPLDEMAACIAAGSHENLIDTLGRIHGHPEKEGLIMQLIPPHYQTLGLPPSLQSCTRDCYEPAAAMMVQKCIGILSGIAAAAAHLHARRISHCDLYAHNILVNDDGHPLLGDFRAATVYDALSCFDFEKLEILSFGHLIEDLLGLLGKDGEGREVSPIVRQLEALHGRCSGPIVKDRPVFVDVLQSLEKIGELGVPSK